jgi:hypothetical protein
MTDKLNQEVKLPSWTVIVFVTVFLAFMGYLTAQVRSDQDVATRVEISAKERAEMKAEISNKADKKEIERIYVTLDKIDEKLDKLIEK